MNQSTQCSRFTRRAGLIALALLVCMHVPARPGAGQSPAADGPAAPTVWDGVYTDEQAARGARSYAEHCSRCHGPTLDGGEYRALRGDRFWTSWQDTTLDRLLTHVSTTMPHSEDGSLKGTLGAGVYADIVAHILSVNAFPAGKSPLTAASSAGVRIVRRDGPTALPAGSFVHVVGCLARGQNAREWKVQRATEPVRVLTGQTVDTAVPLGEREYPLLFVITPLDRFVGHRVSVRGSLVGEGGADGVNVTTVNSVAETCE